MPRTITPEPVTLNAIRVTDLSTDSQATSATLAYEVGVATDTPRIVNGQPAGTDTSFVAHPELANGSSVTLALTDADTIGARKQALVVAALQQESLQPGVDRILTQ